MNVHSFNDIEGLRIAAEMERRGGEYYRRAAKLSHSPEAVDMLLFLAEDEARHLAEFEKLARRVAQERPAAPEYDADTNAYLSAIAAEIVFPGGLMALGAKHGFDSPQAILEGAIESEKDSILFYSALASATQDENSRVVFREIERQERGHLNQLTQMLSRIDVLVDGEFVESLKDLKLRFRGSSNQRIIDVPRSLREGAVRLWKEGKY